MGIDLAALGFDLKLLVAGFMGGLCALYFAENVKPFGACLIVTIGAVTANYGTVLVAAGVSAYFQIAAPIQGSIAFCLGVCALYILGGLRNFAKRWERNPQFPAGKSNGANNANDPSQPRD